MKWIRNRGAMRGVERVSPDPTDLSPVALIGAGPHGVITSWNRSATTLFGWQDTDVVGRLLHDVLRCDEVPGLLSRSGAKRLRTQVSSASGRQLEVELLVDEEAEPHPTPRAHMVAVIPVVSVDDGASPRIENWVDVARMIRRIGGTVDCTAIGLVGVEAVNRGYSRSTGDAVLREVAARLERVSGVDGRAVRVGGNHFVVVAPAGAALDASQLVTLVSQPIDTRLGTVRIGCYAGSVSSDSASGLVVLGRADAAMRLAQARGVGAVECVSDGETLLGARQPRLSSLLIDAVARREIAVSFQPVVELTTGEIIEFEALARWTSDEIGDVNPISFIEAAEDAGLIHELGQIVLARSLDIVQTEVAEGRWGDRRVSVNMSAVQLTHPDLPTRVLEALSERDLPGEVLQLELTGTRLLPDIESLAPLLMELRNIGVRLAIDDFGTGWANMAALRDLPIDVVKIDSRFVANICTSRADAAVVRSIISLARELRVDVIAVGVESSAQHFALTRLGCVAALGFLYSGDREAADLYLPIGRPDRRQSHGYPYPDDEIGRIAALHRADVLDTPAEEVYDALVQAAAELCGTPISLVSLIDEDRQWFKAKVGVDADETPRDVAFCAHAICSAELTEVPNALDDDRFSSNPFVVDNPNVRFYAGAPLRTAAGYSYGTLCVIDTVPRLLTPDQRDGLLRLAHQVTVLLELRGTINQLSDAYGQLELAHQARDEVEASLRHQAHYDSLTALPNRALLMERVEAAVVDSATTGRLFAMLICDVDDFKDVNDGLGHPAGDQLLVEVARRLRSCVREEDTVARFGGDEFVVLINDTDQHAVALLGARILDEMTAPVSTGGRDDIRPTMSIGVALSTPGADGDALLSNADAALYRAKALGGGRMCQFDAALRNEVVDRLNITTEFRAAVTNDELFCLHQPEIDLVGDELFGLESLVRWRHPTRGVLLPEQFVPILEATNGTGALFDRVLHLTLATQADWAARLGQWPNVAVNLSARQLDDSRLADTIRAALVQFSAPAESLWLEVTESALASASTFDTLHEVRALGVHLAIDDFGVGWSSMERLSTFPWDLLKIDRTFITPLGRTDNAELVVKGIISLAHSLGIRTAAEGVETVEQLQQLRDVGCDIVQGFVIARPLPAEETLQRMTVFDTGRQGRDAIGWVAPSGATIH